MIMSKCNFCNSLNLDSVYESINSKIDLQIKVCKECGLVQGDYDDIKYENNNIKFVNKNFTNLDCNASYSDIRVGKQQMVDYFFNMKKEINLNLPKTAKVLDLKSARGHFAIKCLKEFDLNEIDCVEDDEYLLDNYNNNPQIKLYKTKYYEIPKKTYDLIYSCHSLEHYKNPSKYLKFVYDCLDLNGLFYLDVPNIENIDHTNNLDEFFYDKHLFYYDDKTIIQYICSIGFDVVYSIKNNQNISLLFKKTNIFKNYPVTNQYDDNINLIINYKNNLIDNRNKLKVKVKNLNKFFSDGDNLLIGCGRVLDAFIQYGQLNLNNFNHLVDDYLYEVTDNIYNKTLYSRDILKNKKFDKVLILIKNPNSNLLKQVNATTIISLNEILK